MRDSSFYLSPIEMILLDNIPSPEKPEPKLTEVQINKIESLAQIAKSKNHKIAVFSKELDYYCPEHQLSAPKKYDLQKYGRDKIDLRSIYGDFVIGLWVGSNGEENHVSTTITDSGIWTHNLPCRLTDEIDSRKEPLEFVEMAANSWGEDMNGTPIGDLYDFFVTCGPETHGGDPLYCTFLWLEQDNFTIEESKKWIAAGIDIPEDAIRFYKEGLRVPDLKIVIDSGKTIAYKVVYGELSVEEAVKISREATTVLEEVYALEEAANLWGISKSTLEHDLKYPSNSELARKINLGYARKSGNTWIVHKKLMQEFFGNRK